MVQRRSAKMGLYKSKHKHWTKEEVHKLKKLYSKFCLCEVSEKMGRSIPSVQHKLTRLGLRKRKRWTEEEFKVLRKLYTHKPTREIAQGLGATEDVVRAQANRLGVYKASKHIKALGYKGRK